MVTENSWSEELHDGNPQALYLTPEVDYNLGKKPRAPQALGARHWLGPAFCRHGVILLALEYPRIM